MTDTTSEGIRLEDVRRLDLQPGDILAVTVPTDYAPALEDWAHYLREHLADRDVRVVVLASGSELAIVRPAAEELTRQIRDEIRRELHRGAQGVVSFDDTDWTAEQIAQWKAHWDALTVHPHPIASADIVPYDLTAPGEPLDERTKERIVWLNSFVQQCERVEPGPVEQ